MFFFCGRPRHNRAVSPAKEAICRECGKKGNFVKVCQNSKSARDSSSSNQFYNCVASLPFCYTIRKLKVPVLTCKGQKVSKILTSLKLSVKGQCQVTVIGEEALLDICSVAAANIEPAQLFTHLSPNCKPISIKSRRYTDLLKEGIVEKSVSPWHAQVMVVTCLNHRCKMAVDYSQTINRYTELDAFPLPPIEDVNKAASYKIYSCIDLCSAYYQVPIREEDKPYTVFEARGQLYQFTHVPVGIRYGVL
ncbi:hypothetical protein PR048_013190, partial [Dryococelus australis]